MNVLVIPEDFTKDQWMLKPIIKSMLAEIGKPRANVEVCFDPRFRGFDDVRRWDRLSRVLDKYGMVDLFLLCVDRDQVEGRTTILHRLEQQGCRQLHGGHALLAENAWQEIEVWVLAGMDDLPREWTWRSIRDDRDPKESYFQPYAKSRGLLEGPGEGRKALGVEASRNYRRIRSRCPEDVARLEDRVREWLGIYETPAGDTKLDVLNWLGVD